MATSGYIKFSIATIKACNNKFKYLSTNRYAYLSLTKNPPNSKKGIIRGGPIAVAICTVGDIADIKYPVIRMKFPFLMVIQIQQINWSFFVFAFGRFTAQIMKFFFKHFFIKLRI